MLNVRNVLLLAKQTQVHTEETRGVGMEVAQNYTKKPEMPPVTFVVSLCKIHALVFRKLQMFMTFGLENLFGFGKFSDFHCITPET